MSHSPTVHPQLPTVGQLGHTMVPAVQHVSSEKQRSLRTVCICVETNIHPDALPTANRLPVSVEMTQCIEENYEVVVDITADALVEDSEYSE